MPHMFLIKYICPYCEKEHQQKVRGDDLIYRQQFCHYCHNMYSFSVSFFEGKVNSVVIKREAIPGETLH